MLINHEELKKYVLRHHQHVMERVEKMILTGIRKSLRKQRKIEPLHDVIAWKKHHQTIQIAL